MSILKSNKKYGSDYTSKKKIASILNFQPSVDGKMGPCDHFNYNFRTNKFWFALVAPIIKFLCNRGWKVKVEGKENIPRDSNVIFMPNHVSHFDGFLLEAYFPKAPIVIGDEKLFYNKYLNVFWRMMNVFPVRKGSKSMAIVEYSIARANSGDSMLWFPEGQRHKNPSINKCNSGKKGSGMFAHGITTPIVPVFIQGSEFAMPVGRKLSMGRGPRSIEIKLKFGKAVPLDDLREKPPSKEVSQEVADRIIEHIEKLRPKGAYMIQKTRHKQNRPL